MRSDSSYMTYIYVALGFLAADAAISMGFVTSMVQFLHTSGQGPFRINDNDGSFLFYGEPEHAHIIADQGHTTNGAGGTALVLLGFGGILTLWLENRSRKKSGKSHPLFNVWSVLVVLSWLLTTAALIYTFVVTAQTANQTIDISKATTPANHPELATLPYPYLKWTPENWYKAVLQLNLADQSDIDLINHNLHLMTGWRYNLIVLFILGFILMDLVILEHLRLRRTRGEYAVAAQNLDAKQPVRTPPEV
ncbi:hypothetical protein GQ53DRAFT_802052 [Thozetella sp. PMI_491]|nr:hypothetical protein GQ53DRAFT_802052 [Thozetella sp. PMI_491]